MRNVKFNDLRLQNRKYENAFQNVLRKLLNKGVFLMGNEVQEFEREYARYIGLKFGIGVASGTDAITLSLLSLQLKSSDEVAIPVNVYPVAFAAASAGLNIKLIDIDPNTFNLDINDLTKKVTQKTKVIILVHLYGKAANIDAVLKFAKKRNIKVIEDCSQAHGTLYRSKKVGSFGYINCFSFYPTKNLGSLGDGGMILTSDRAVADRIRALRQYGEVKRYESRYLGKISRMDEIQAAFLRVKLKNLNEENKKRMQKAEMYIKRLTTLNEIILPKYDKKLEHTYHLFVIKTKRRDALKKYLEKKGVQVAIHYPYLINEIPPFSYLKSKGKLFPNASQTNKEILSLPLYASMPEEDIEYVSLMIKKFYGG